MDQTLILSILLTVVANHNVQSVIGSTEDDRRMIPKGLMLGAGTSAYQIEGAWDQDGKSESIMDRIVHENECYAFDCKNGDIAADSYNNIERDVQIMAELGLDHYRFSISWTRILPKGFANEINQAGIDHYKKFIDEMLKYNIEPVITMYHWDLPQVLQDFGGWLNPLIADWFEDYARILFNSFGNKVKKWVTINEPLQICYFGYESVLLAPGLNLTGTGNYLCTKNILMAHARAWHLYDNEYRAIQKGNIGITIATESYIPESLDHIEAAQDINDFYWGIFAHPIFSQTGDFPQRVKDRIAAKSFAQGYPRSRLPELTIPEIRYIRGTSDFFGLNHYTTYIAYRNESVYGIYPSPSWMDDIDAYFYQPSDWEISSEESVKIVPWGFKMLLTKIRNEYNNPPVFISENGYTYNNKGLNDNSRILYYHSYINAVLDAIDEGSNIFAYTAWSLMDNFEWWQGYTQRYGLYEVDFDSPSRTRTPRDSAYAYQEIIRTRSVPRTLPDIPSNRAVQATTYIETNVQPKQKITGFFVPFIRFVFKQYIVNI